MSYTLIKKHTKVNYNKGGAKRIGISVHNTGNKTDSAENNAKYFYSEKRGASANYFVDDEFVYEVVAPTDTAWAIGKFYGGSKTLFNIFKNSNTISIEMCSKGGVITTKTLNNTAELIQKLCKEFDIPYKHIYRHYDICGKQCPTWEGWTNKNCPHWTKLLAKVYGVNKGVKIHDTVKDGYTYLFDNKLNSIRKIAEGKTVYVLDKSCLEYAKGTLSKVLYAGKIGYVKDRFI